jgi:chromate transporter
MSPDLPRAAVPVDTRTPAAPPELLELFLAFAKISLSGFGGVLVFARRAIVEKYRWMTADEFNETYALCHFLPGPNICNLSVVFGARIRGIPGSFAAFAGLVGPPIVIVSALAMMYARYGEIPALQRTLAGVSCAAVGLVIGAAGRMTWPLVKRRDPAALGFLVCVFAAIGLFRWPLVPVLLVAIPLSIAGTWAMREDAAA